jgi:hypothetical protein
MTKHNDQVCIVSTIIGTFIEPTSNNCGLFATTTTVR